MHQSRSIEKGCKFLENIGENRMWRLVEKHGHQHLTNICEQVWKIQNIGVEKPASLEQKWRKRMKIRKKIYCFLIKISIENYQKSFTEFFTASSLQVNTYGRQDQLSKYFLDFGLGILRWSLLSTILSIFV